MGRVFIQGEEGGPGQGRDRTVALTERFVMTSKRTCFKNHRAQQGPRSDEQRWHSVIGETIGDPNKLGVLICTCSYGDKDWEKTDLANLGALWFSLTKGLIVVQDSLIENCSGGKFFLQMGNQWGSDMSIAFQLI